MTTPTLLITPRRAALLAPHDNELDVLVRVQAPQAPAELPKRQPLHLALVIDRSGSMAGQPLEQAKRCAEFVLDGLLPTDRLSVVAYDDEAQTLVPAVELRDKDAVRRAIRQIDEGGRTNLHGGWLQGAETLAPHTHDRLTSRVILLSDGCANRGITEHDPIYAQCAELARAGVTTSTYGLGRSFNEELMIGMARHGRHRRLAAAGSRVRRRGLGRRQAAGAVGERRRCGPDRAGRVLGPLHHARRRAPHDPAAVSGAAGAPRLRVQRHRRGRARGAPRR